MRLSEIIVNEDDLKIPKISDDFRVDHTVKNPEPRINHVAFQGNTLVVL